MLNGWILCLKTQTTTWEKALLYIKHPDDWTIESQKSLLQNITLNDILKSLYLFKKNKKLGSCRLSN